MGHNSSNCWELEANKDEKKRKDELQMLKFGLDVPKLVQSSIKTARSCMKLICGKLALQKLEEIPVPSNPPDDNKYGMGNINN